MLCSKLLNNLKNYKQLDSTENQLKIEPLINSITPKIKVKTKNELIIFLGFKL